MDDAADLEFWRQRCRTMLLSTNPPSWAKAFIRHTAALEEEVARLRSMVEGLAGRVVAQSELLTRRAERQECESGA